MILYYTLQVLLHIHLVIKMREGEEEGVYTLNQLPPPIFYTHAIGTYLFEIWSCQNHHTSWYE